MSAQTEMVLEAIADAYPNMRPADIADLIFWLWKFHARLSESANPGDNDQDSLELWNATQAQEVKA